VSDTNWPRRLAALCWVVIAVVLLRAASGGGLDPGSFRYVADREPPLTYAVGAVVVLASLAFAAALVSIASPRVMAAAATVGVLTAAYGAFIAVFDHHPSGILVAVAGLAATLLAALSMRRHRARDVSHLSGS
jgi:hypothetical protein